MNEHAEWTIKHTNKILGSCYRFDQFLGAVGNTY